MTENLAVGFLGAGKMATALAAGWVQAGIVARDQVLASDLFEGARSRFSDETGLSTTDSNAEVLAKSTLILLAVKPQVMDGVLAEIGPLVQPHHLLVSIAAGVPLGQLQSRLPNGARVVRVMPNTPCLVGAGACAFSGGAAATRDDLETVRTLFATVGVAYEVPEKLLDAVTGLSGSGPAYIFQAIEAMSDGGVRMGLPRDVATSLAAQTVLGAAKMVLETGLHPAVLKDAVASPGGTTIAGLEELERCGMRNALISAVRAASERSLDLSRHLSQDETHRQ